MKINQYGQEVLSSKPIAAPVRVGPSPNTLEALAAQYRMAYELAKRIGQDPESPQEAEDFNVGDYDDSVPFEHFADRYDEDLFQQMLALHQEQISRSANLQSPALETGTSDSGDRNLPGSESNSSTT